MAFYIISTQSILEIIPFIGIIFLEVSGKRFIPEWENVYYSNKEEDSADISNKFNRIRTYSLFSYDWHNTKQHSDATIIFLTVILVGKMINNTNEVLEIGLVLVVTLILFLSLKNIILGYFGQRSPSKYYINDTVSGIHYGNIFIILFNIFIILVIVATDSYII